MQICLCQSLNRAINLSNRTGCTTRPLKLEPQKGQADTSDGSIQCVQFRRNFEFSTASLKSFQLRVGRHIIILIRNEISISPWTEFFC